MNEFNKSDVNDELGNNNSFDDKSEVKDTDENACDNTNAQDSLESEKKDGQEHPEQEKVSDKAAECSLGTDASKEGAASDEENTAGQNTDCRAPKYSTSYSPPYYVPNFTVTQGPGGAPDSEATAQKPSAKKRRWLVPVIAVVVVASVCIAGALGMGVRHAIRNLLNGDAATNDETTEVQTNNAVGAETVTIIKNDGSIEVDEQIGSTGYSGLSISEITALVADSVVEINTSQTVNTFYGQYVTGGAGSGVIIGHAKSSGAYYIVTNHHVIDGADSVKVRLRNGESYSASIVGSSKLDDLAVLRISAKNNEKLTVATLGNSANLKVGDGVVAIGNPLGTLGGTVTDGIISALDREIMVENIVMVLLQTNAAINPGNSGGGLFNSAGELIGIVNAKQSQTGIEGLGFAIPIDLVSDCIDDIIEYGYVKGHSSLGVEVQNVSVSSGFSSSSYVQVTKATSGSALKVGDIIYSINGQTVSSVGDFNACMYQLDIGDEVKVQIIVRNSVGQGTLSEKTLKVVEYNPNELS